MPLQFSVIAARSTGDFYYTFYDFVHYLNQRPPFKGNFAPPLLRYSGNLTRGTCIGVQRAIFPPLLPSPYLRTLSHLSRNVPLPVLIIAIEFICF